MPLTSSSMMPQFSRMNPISGFARIFSTRGLVELVKGIAKVFVVGLIAVVLLKGLTSQLMGLSGEPVNQAIGHSASMASYSLLILCMGLAIIAASDLTLVVSAVERDLLATDAPGAPVQVLSNLHRVSGPGAPFGHRRRARGGRGRA